MLWLEVVSAETPDWGASEEARRRFVESIYHKEAASLVRLARIFTDDRASAEDIVQEAFIKLFRAADRITDPGRSVSYLRSIVLNLSRDHNRRGLMSLRHQNALLDGRQPVSPDEQFVVDEDQSQVLSALAGLSPRQRDCLVLRFYYEMSEREIGEALEISPNSVKTHCRRGLETLGRTLGESV